MLFWVLISLHLKFLLQLECFFYYSCFHCFFFPDGVNIFCRLQKYWCKLYVIWNHSIINALKFVHQWRSIFCIYALIIILYHLQMIYILYFTYSTVCSPTRSSVSHCVKHSNAYHSIQYYYTMALILYKNVVAHKCAYATSFHVPIIQMRMRN